MVNNSVAVLAQSVADIISNTFTEKISSMESENKMLKKEIEVLSKKVDELERFKGHANSSLDNAEQYSRRSCLRISGVKSTTGESTGDIVLDIAKACNVDLSLFDIDRSHRILPRKSTSKTSPPDIIVKFVSYRSRSAFFRGKSRLKNNTNYKGVFINEDLTRYRSSLLWSARRVVKNGKADSAWTTDGRVFLKGHDGKRHLITTESDLVNF